MAHEDKKERKRDVQGERESEREMEKENERWQRGKRFTRGDKTKAPRKEQWHKGEGTIAKKATKDMVEGKEQQ
jgi:hypothetical protein